MAAIGKWLKRIGKALSGEQTWKEIHVSLAIRPDETMRRYSWLRSHGIRCKIISLGMTGTRGTHTGSVVLRVHKDDLHKAYALLKDLPG